MALLSSEIRWANVKTIDNRGAGEWESSITPWPNITQHPIPMRAWSIPDEAVKQYVPGWN